MNPLFSFWRGHAKRGWDEGVTHFERLITPPAEEPLDINYVVDKVLRVANDGYDADYVAKCITAARERFEAETLKAAVQQTRALVLDRFPASWIELPRPPLISVATIEYYDAAGELQTMLGSPAEFLTIPSGEYVPARVMPLVGASWPATAQRPDAVTVTYDCGYEIIGSPSVSLIPATYLAGMGLIVGELYKQRSLSIDGRMVPSTIQTDRFWRRIW